MRPPLACALVVIGLAAAASAGCGTRIAELPPVCRSTQAAAIERALSGAPDRVALAGGTRLSTCIANATSDGDLQTMGFVYTQAANRLSPAAQRSDTAALRLGYLLGATRRGGRNTEGIHFELIRRIEQSVGLDGAPPRHRSAFARGERAGRARG